MSILLIAWAVYLFENSASSNGLQKCTYFYIIQLNKPRVPNNNRSQELTPLNSRTKIVTFSSFLLYVYNECEKNFACLPVSL